MTFPATPRGIRGELYIGGTWVDISADIYERDGVRIRRGKSDEAGQAAPSSMQLTLNNRDGKYSPRNPMSPYYGQLGRNTPIRLQIGGPQSAPLYDASSTSTEGATTRSWTHTPTGTPRGVLVFVVQNGFGNEVTTATYGGVAMTKIVASRPTENGHMVVFFLGTGVLTGARTVVVNVSGTSSPKWCTAVTLTSPDGLDLQVDSVVEGVGTGVTAPPTASQAVAKSDAFAAGFLVTAQNVAAQVAPGTGYTEVSERSFVGTDNTVASIIRKNATVPSGSSVLATWASPTVAEAYAVVAVSAVLPQNRRFWGEVASFPARWELSGNDAWVPLEAAGQLRRLNQGVDPPATGLRTFTLASTGLQNYWPLEGGVGTAYSLDIGGSDTLRLKFFGWPGTAAEGGPSFRYGEPFGSDYLGTGMAYFYSNFGYMRADIGTSAQNVAVDFVWSSPELGTLTIFMDDYAGFGWGVRLDGEFNEAQVSFDDPSLGPVGFLPVPLPEANDEQIHHCRFQLTKSGTATNWALYVDGVSISSGTQTSYNLTGMSILRMFYERVGTESWVVLGHLTIWADSSVTWPSAAACAAAAFGYVGEPAGDRIERICGLSGIALTADGDLSDTMPMGPQHNEGLLTQLRDAEGADFGLLTEPRDAFGLLYRTHRQLYNQDAAVTLQYGAGHLAPPFEPVEDDQLTRNDITATRRDGGSYRAQLTSGSMSVSEPPTGVGRYRDEVTANVENDDLLPPVAGWLLYTGTLDEARYPTITVNLAAPDVAGDNTLTKAILSADIGDRIVITDADAINVYDDISLIVLGYSETFSTFQHSITFNCAPGTAYEVLELDDADSRVSSGGSTLNSALSTSGTSVSVITSGNQLWTTTAGQMPFRVMVAGEEMTVTAISGTTPGSAQTFTVTRAVNGVVKSHAAGTPIELKRAAVVAL